TQLPAGNRGKRLQELDRRRAKNICSQVSEVSSVSNTELFKRLRIVCLIVVASAGLYAQSTNSQQISGQILDSSGAAVPTATVKVTSADTGLSRSVQSNESGYYSTADLPIGSYEISAEAPGFKKAVVTNVKLSVNEKRTANLTMELGSISDSITVQADSLQVETSGGEVGRLITGQQASQIQLNGRNFPQLLALAPGVSTTYSSGFGLFGGYGVNASGQSANGGRTDT